MRLRTIGRPWTYSLVLGLLVWPLLGTSAEPAAYQVELLAFLHSNAAQPANGAPAAPLLDIEEAVRLDGSSDDRYFHALPASELKLATARSILDGSPSYEVIAHLAWRQPGLSEAAAKAVRIEAGPEYRAYTAAPDLAGPGLYTEPEAEVRLKQLDGTAKLVLGRYLHIVTDLVLRKPVTTQVTDIEQQAGSTKALYQFRILGHRRMRSDELHYLDHPLLGILVQVTPIEHKSADVASGTME